MVSDLGGHDAPTIDRRGSKLRDPIFLLATVRKAETIVGRIRRISIEGAALNEVLPCRPAAKVRLLIPAAGRTVPELPTWSPRGLVWPPGCQTVMRSYTVRRQRTDDPGQIVVDMLLHDNGPGGAWAAAARPGDHVGLIGPEPAYTPRATTRTHVLIGDEVALPTIAAIVDALPAAADVITVVETRDERFHGYLEHAPVTWLTRGARAPGTMLLAYVERLTLPRQGLQAFVAAEATPTRHLREHLRSRYGLSLTDGSLYAKGFWKLLPGG
jgi:NADPH-dependent ferric siderophore reductase